LVLASVATAACGFAAVPASAAKLQCGQTVTTSVKLTDDLLNCTKDGLVVGASGITIDLNGHRITGPSKARPGNPSCLCGVSDQAGFDGVTLKSGRIEGFREGARFVDADAVTVRDLVTNGQHGRATISQGGNGVVLERAHRAHVSGSTFTDAYRGLYVADSSDVLIDNVQITKIGHSGVAMFRDTESTVREANIDTGGGDWSVELINSSRNLVERNLITQFGVIGIGVIGATFAGNLPAIGNKIESNTVREAVTGLQATGVLLGEEDGGVQRETTVADNTVTSAEGDGVWVSSVNSGDGQGNPPFDILVGEGPSDSVIKDNVVNGNAPEGIHLDAPGNVLTGNIANDNADWGILAIEGTIDGGGNRAQGNGQPQQCSGVVCNR
jgi:parallel beta-helix repeat protein